MADYAGANPPYGFCIGSFVIARSEATKQSSSVPRLWIASLRSQ
jgi:hypothetical protein